MTRWTTRTLLSLLCLEVLSSRAWADPCKRNADGSVTCTEAGLKTLTDGIIDLRAKVKVLEAKNTALTEDKVTAQRLTLVCQDNLMELSKPMDSTKVMSGYTLGLVSMGMLTAGVLADVSYDVRLSLVGAGLVGAFVGGAWLMP